MGQARRAPPAVLGQVAVSCPPGNASAPALEGRPWLGLHSRRLLRDLAAPASRELVEGARSSAVPGRGRCHRLCYLQGPSTRRNEGGATEPACWAVGWRASAVPLVPLRASSHLSGPRVGAWGEGGARQQGVGECPDPEGLDWLAMRGIHWRGSVQKEQAWCDGRPVPRELRGSASDRGTHEAPATSERSRWGLETSSPLLNRYEISCNDKTNRQIQNEKR